MALNTSGPPYKFDFLEQIVAINFPPRGGYMLIELLASKVALGLGPASCPTVSFNLGANETIADRRETCTKTVIPGSSTEFSFFYVWHSSAQIPTADTFFDVIALDPFFTYGVQFTHLVNMGLGFVPPGSYSPDLGGYSGVWDTFAEAQAYADLWNARFVPGVGGFPYPEMMWNDVGGTITIIGPFDPEVSVRSLTHTVVVPPSNRGDLRGLYLIKVPRELTSLQITVTGATSTPEVTVRGYHGATPSSISNVNPEGYDTIATGLAANPITSRVDKIGPQGQDFTTVTASGGGSGGSG